MPGDRLQSARVPVREKRRPAKSKPAQAKGTESEFNESAYLAAFPDVARAVRRGGLNSASEHYRLAGQLERRLEHPDYLRQLGHQPADVAAEMPLVPQTGGPPVNLEAAALSASGAIFLAGWSDDRHTPLSAISVRQGRRQWSWNRIPRVRRTDVEAAVGSLRPHQYGFWLFGLGAAPGGAAPGGAALGGAALGGASPAGSDCDLILRFADGQASSARRPPSICSDVELRDMVLGYLATASYCGNRSVEVFANLDCGAGEALIGFNRAICRAIAGGATVSRFGPQLPRYRASIIVPLYGIGDYLFLQSCAYSQGRGIAEYEFIYVVNSPELAEQLHREARIAEMIYGLTVSLVILPDNAGFGMANNVGVQFARSDRILCVNPDVFPRDPDWAQRHTDLLASLPAEQTRLFGASLFYDDGSLMHGGMYFEADAGIMSGQGRMAQQPLLRVEHYGKGAPPWATQYVASRPVPAVTGAFMSIDRPWFEKLGGFTETYVFGHYEDADLCLKSLKAGTPVWLHDLPMWHLEGKGSRRLPHHEGGSLINRWLFTRNWASTLLPDLIGRNPRLLPPQAEPAATPQQNATQQRPAPPRATSARDARIRAV